MINTEYTAEMIPQLLQCVFNPDILKKHQGVIGIRKLISTEVDPPIQPVIDAGIIQECINMIKQDQYPQLKLEATWVLTNIASGTAEQTHALVEKDVIPLMIQLMHEN
jgi:importin subunit alpha-1